MGWIRYLFFEKKHLAYTAFGQNMYFKATSKLNQHGVPCDVARKMTAKLFGTPVHPSSPDTRNAVIDTAQYDLYV